MHVMQTSHSFEYEPRKKFGIPKVCNSAAQIPLPRTNLPNTRCAMSCATRSMDLRDVQGSAAYPNLSEMNGATMKRESRRSDRARARNLKRCVLLDFDRLEIRQLLSTTYTVVNTNSSGSGSLYDAITQLDMDVTTPSSPNVIQFDIPGGGAQTITLSQQLPDITQPTDVQGYTQPGSSANTNPLTMSDNAVFTLIVSGGGSMSNDGLIFDASASGSSVEGLDLVGFTGGVAISVNSNNTAVTGNFIGVGVNGVPTSSTTNFDGVVVSGASGDSIGGTVAADRNVITGNTFEAVTLGPVGAVYSSNDVIEGNFIGTNADLSAVTNPSLVNDFGVLLYPSAGNSIGGTAAGAGNVISGNTTYGVGTQNATGLVLAGDVIQDNGTVGVLLISTIGASITSSTIGGVTAGQGNPSYGIYLENSTNTTIGGTVTGAGDLIAGNGGNGITVDDTSNGTMVAGSTITGNTVVGVSFNGQGGSSLSGEVLVGDVIQSNTIGGVLITDAPGTTITSSTIGGTTSGLGNTGYGISASGSANVSIRSSTISHNTADGVDFNNSPNAIMASDTVQTNGGHGVVVTTSNGTSIISSTIGGTTAGSGNSTGGISVVGSSNVTIGGTLAGAGDSISGNTGIGVSFNDTSSYGLAAGSTISGNTSAGVSFNGQSGSSLSGEVMVGDVIQSNLSSGVLITDAPGAIVTSSTIGGATSGLGNTGDGLFASGSANVGVMSSTVENNTADGIDLHISPNAILTADTVQTNGGHGVLLSISNGTSITSSTIGGTTMQGNGLGGVSVADSSNVSIGGTIAGAGDSISGNTGIGVSFNDTSSDGFVVGSTISSNTAAGVGISSSGNTIGGTTAGAGNVIASNSGAGVGLDDLGTAPTGNLISGNSIVSNGALGIDLDNYSGVPLPNNSGNPNNNGQNYPVITSVGVTTGGATAKGTLEAAVDATYTVEFFLNNAADSSGYGQGQTFLTSRTVTTDATGNATFSVFLGNSVTLGKFISATATDSNNNTSEFSLDSVAMPTTMTVVTSSANPTVYGQSVTFTATVTVVSPGSGTTTGTVAFFDGATDLGAGTSAGAGVWTFAISSLAVGTHGDITAQYSGDVNFLASVSADFSQSVDQAASLTTVASTPNPSTYGQLIAFTATVSAVSPGSGTPTGTVTFFDGATNLGIATPDGAGVWTFATSSLTTNASPGHSITAVYSGDVDFGTTTSSPLSVVVNAAQTNAGNVVLLAAQTYYGQTVTLTAAFSATGNGSDPMTGTVAFYDGATYLGTASLVANGASGGSGQASLAAQQLAVGSQILSAVYSGDVNYAPALSETTVSVEMSSTASTTTLAAATTGESTMLTANVVVTSSGNPPLGGMVAFYDGATSLGSEPLANGVANLNVKGLAAGLHNFSAVFTGEGTISPSQASLDVSTANPTVLSAFRSGVRNQPGYLFLRFSTPLNPASAEDLSNYSLVGPSYHKGGRRYPVRIKSAVYDSVTQTVILSTAERWSIDGLWQIRVNGATSGGVKGASGAMLNGTARRPFPLITTAGSNYVRMI